MRNLVLALLAACALLAGPLVSSGRAAPGLADGVNEAAVPEGAAAPSRELLIRVATLLDRAGISPGVIDGHRGDNFDKAVAAYRASRGLPAGALLDAALLDRLRAEDVAPALTAYEVTSADAEGPWTKEIPAKMEAQAHLERLGYRDAAEMLAERFHMDVDLLRELNRGKALDRPGETLMVASVRADQDPTRAATYARATDRTDAAVAADTVRRIVVDKRAGTLEAFGRSGARILFAPASIGSAEKPAPSGTLKVTRVALNPNYTYDPDYAFKGVRTKKPFEIAPGPNNPVGVVWIALDREGYGLHGTPEPSRVGKTESHGCIRLTNWTAFWLATMVGKGVEVEFRG